MKRTIFIILLCAVVFGISAEAEYGRQIFDESSIKTERPAPYMKHVNSWRTVEPEKIYTDSDNIVFYTDLNIREFSLNAEVMPFMATDKTITYSSSDTTVASVDSDGVVRATGKIGDAVITLKAGKVVKNCNVSMRKGVKGVTLSAEAAELYADKPEPIQLGAYVYPEDATLKDVIWYSEDASIATVDSDGTVIPCGVGETNIIAKTADGSHTAKCDVFVTLMNKPLESAKTDVVYTHYSYSVEEAADAQMDTDPTVFTSKAYPAYRSEVEQCIDPQPITDGSEKYQFLDLSSPNGVSAETLNNYLRGKGVLEGMGEVFVEAARECGISEVYLAVHAALESGNGFSQLATGTDYYGTTVYNMFGIGAVDSAPLQGGTEYAYRYGWTSVEEAIRGGAIWIANNYINNGQNTLYKMRWNPDKPATHQYASDIEWSIKQARTLKNMFDAFPDADLRFEIPVYKGQSEPKVK